MSYSHSLTKFAIVLLLLSSASLAETLPIPHPPKKARLPKIFEKPVRELKSSIRFPILLPDALPNSTNFPLVAFVGHGSAYEYGIGVHYVDGSGSLGDINMCGTFSGKSNSRLPEVPGEEVQLTANTIAKFRAVSCGGSCAPANLWWVQNGVLYTISLKLRSDLDESEQKRRILEMANSAIAAGPR